MKQINLQPEAGAVRKMPYKRIAACDTVIHMAGEVYGAELQQRSTTKQLCRSYTQMCNMTLFWNRTNLCMFLSVVKFSYDEYSSDGEEEHNFQRIHR